METLTQLPTITPSPEVEFLMETARQQWPDVSPERLLLNLAGIGAKNLQRSVREARIAELRRSADRINALYGHSYPEDYLEKLRNEW